jgi:phosphoglucomutase
MGAGGSSAGIETALSNSSPEELKAALANIPEAKRQELLKLLGGGSSTQITCDLTATTVNTAPIAGQKPGTSGLRKKTKEFMSANYLANYVQSVLNTLKDLKVPVEGGTLVVSGDGRYWNPEAIQIIIKMAFAAGVGKIWCGQYGLLSTPATSAVIRCRGAGNIPFGGFICSASHNPGGINDDFGIKYNCENGGPSPEKMTDLMVEWTAKITEYKICNGVPDIDLTKPASYVLGDRTVEVFDCVEDHLALLKKCFDFESMKKLIANPEFTLTYDCMSGVQGPYARGIVEGALGAAAGSCKNADPKPDFGGPDSAWHGHADPNLTYAVELVADMGLNKEGQKIATSKPIPKFGAAADGDADRNMILSSQFFCSPSDSLAMIVANSDLIPQFAGGLKGCARSMPTSGAVDRVAEKKGIKCFEVPTGWKFFGNLMDSGTSYFPDKETYTPFICGEESFGTGADHVREKDGMWAVLAWLQILAKKSEAAGKLVSVEDVANAHWKEYGRNYYTRYDYEGVDKAKAEEMMKMMGDQSGALVGQEFGGMKMKINDIFEYNDPVDGSVSKNQGIRFIFEDGSRIIFRLSGTGVAGATVRLYLEKYESPSGDLTQHQFDVVKPLATIALQLSKLQEYTGRDAPTVIT